MSNADATDTLNYNLTDAEIADIYKEVFALRAKIRGAQAFFKGTPLEGLFEAAMEWTWTIRTSLEIIDTHPGRKRG